jgi:hypothetical protein
LFIFQDKSPINKGVRVLSEHDVSSKWRQLFHKSTIDSETVFGAEALLEELRPESPLRHRLTAELDEICHLRRIRRLDNKMS